MPNIDEFFERVAELRREGATFAVATVVSRRGPVSSHLGDRAIVFDDGRMDGFVGGSCSRDLVRREAVAAIVAGAPRLVSIRPDAELQGAHDAETVVLAMSCGSKGAVDVYIEPFAPARIVVVVGMTPVAESLARLSATLEYAVVRVVSRDELRDFHDESARVLALDGLDGLLAGLTAPARENLAVVIASQGHYDESALATVLRHGAGYVGLVASARRTAEVRTFVSAGEVDAAALDAVHAPAGLDLGARNPGEVALSILAEIAQVRPSPRAVAAPTLSARPEPAPVAPLAVDPVCGMQLEPRGESPHAQYGGATYSFCCEGCRARFVATPEQFLAGSRP
jgi:xanthine dehydrogenase accessory factor